tara:strand:+ start:562 stop:729 length:168 start_codon:yes stop_codon:yes gene_type:complete
VHNYLVVANGAVKPVEGSSREDAAVKLPIVELEPTLVFRLLRSVRVLLMFIIFCP